MTIKRSSMALFAAVALGTAAVVLFSSASAQVVAPTYFAQLNASGKVMRVIVVSQEQLNTGRWGDPKTWVQTSIDAGNVYAGVGYSYSSSTGLFATPTGATSSSSTVNVGANNNSISGGTSTPL